MEGVVWSSEGKTQDDFMLKDECLLVNYMDEVVGHENKYNSHKFIASQSKGIVHRAFSVLLFDAEGKLLLQQRAASKITFAEVWTNTCCSHPLYGMSPSELDGPEAVMKGDPVGVKHAAVRKLKHELGMEGIAYDRFRFLTRVHYWACDVGTHGPDAPWGEHEIDYVLVCQLRKGEVIPIAPEPDEVMAIKWVDADELKKAMQVGKWSPWFKIIAERFLLPKWWTDLKKLCDPKDLTFADYGSIHRFDCHAAGTIVGAGNAVAGALDALDARPDKKDREVVLAEERAQLLADIAGTTKVLSKDTNVSSADKKQGAYGKVATHKHSLLAQFSKPLEVLAALRLKLGPGKLPVRLTASADRYPAASPADVAFCDDMLGRVSRSFAAVIRQLPDGLCLDVCVFYLVLRALDTIEDDMVFFKGNEAAKEARLRAFSQVELKNADCSVDDIGEGDERTLLQKFGAVVRALNSLPKESYLVITDIASKMGAGMADYVTAELAQGTEDSPAYDAYCHAVAGLVGEGLTRLFVANGYESKDLEGSGSLRWPFCTNNNTLGLANSMGLFLQKTNIIRDYLEDYVDGRAFWPKSVWKAHANSNDLGEFTRATARGGLDPKVFKPGSYPAKVAQKGASDRGLCCLNALIADALQLAPDALEYLNRIKTPTVYRFCAIPQIMAAATLAECFDNQDLFTGVVKIRKGQAARCIVDTARGHDATLVWFHAFATDMLAKLPAARATDDTKANLHKACTDVIAITQPAYAAKKRKDFILFATLASVGSALLLGFSLKALK